MKLFIPNYKTLRDVCVLVNRLMVFSVRVVHCAAVRTANLIAFAHSIPFGLRVAVTKPSSPTLVI